MPLDQRAYIDVNRAVLGQVIVCRSFLFAPLHVVDYRTASSLVLLDRWGQIEEPKLSEVVSVDPACDAVLFRTTAWERTEWSNCIASSWDSGTEVEVRAIMRSGDNRGSSSNVMTLRSWIREIVEIERHAYETATGRLAVARNVRALFLTDPLPWGWSGAPVYVKGTSAIAGFVHGNASANHGSAVCLVPSTNSILLRTILQRTESR